MRLSRPLVLLVAAALAAAPAAAYTIYLKDGTRIVAREKYTVEGDLAILYQLSGTKSSIPLAQIDAKRTEEANVGLIDSNAIVIEGGKVEDVKRDTKPAPVRPRIQDLIKSNEAGIRTDRTAPAAAPLLPSAAVRAAPDAKAGAKGTRAPYPNVALATEIRGFVTARGVAGIEVYAGASPTWPQLVYSTASEGAVFKALVTGANLLLHMQSARPGEIEGVEVVCVSPEGGSGGRFQLSQKQAEELVSGKTEITRFYVENVIF
jgi:hypothetical protein